MCYKTQLSLVALLGIVTGLGMYTIHYAEGLSYFSTDPRACANCHIMQRQFDSWQKSGHHHVATCVGCHLPQSFPEKYIAKAENGYHHSRGFTFQDFHEPIIIKDKNAIILQDNCTRCHKDIVSSITHPVSNKSPLQSIKCVHCHSSVGHGPRAGLGGFYSADEIQGGHQ